MKRALPLMLILCVTTLFANAQVKTLVQTKQMAKPSTILFEVSDKLNGDDLIDRLVAQRREFNNSRSSAGAVQLANLPNPEYIFNRNGLTTITFDGLEYMILDNRVVSIKGLDLSEEVLALITEKLLLLDKVQFDYCAKSNKEYLNAGINSQNIRNIDRWFFTSLKILSTTVGDIASFTKKTSTTETIAANIAKMPRPNIDSWKEKQVDQSLVQLTK